MLALSIKNQVNKPKPQERRNLSPSENVPAPKTTTQNLLSKFSALILPKSTTSETLTPTTKVKKSKSQSETYLSKNINEIQKTSTPWYSLSNIKNTFIKVTRSIKSFVRKSFNYISKKVINFIKPKTVEKTFSQTRDGTPGTLMHAVVQIEKAKLQKKISSPKVAIFKGTEQKSIYSLPSSTDEEFLKLRADLEIMDRRTSERRKALAQISKLQDISRAS